jgi:DNA helicase HerA-like ATPase
MGSLFSSVGGLLGSFIPIPGLGPIIGSMVGSGLGKLAGAALGLPESYQDSTTSTITDTFTRSHSFTRSIAETLGTAISGGVQGGYNHQWNRNMAVSYEEINKTAEYCEQICDNYIKRLQGAKNLGFWNVGVYLLTDNPYAQIRGSGLLRAALSGDETYWEPIRTLEMNDSSRQQLACFNNPRYQLFEHGVQTDQLEHAIKAGQQLALYAKDKNISSEVALKKLGELAGKDTKQQALVLNEIRALSVSNDASQELLEKAWGVIKHQQLGHPLGEGFNGVSTPMNTEELAILMNVPREEIHGITIRSTPRFGVNYVAEPNEIKLGKIVHKGGEINKFFGIPPEQLTKHGFICGVTGAGKTNTCLHLLKELNRPFLVIEPAKTEYRQLLNLIPDLRIFTLGQEMVSPFRLNPFEFIRGTELLSHIDYLKAVFNAAFPMYASMPYLLEEAIYEVYLDKGWILATSQNRYFNEDAPDDVFYDYLPTLQDLLDKIDVVVKSKHYAQQLTMDLSAALKARLSSLIHGGKGFMLNVRRSIPWQVLFDSQVVLELRAIGDDDEKCFLMGLLFTMLYEYRQKHHDADGTLKHVTLIEEAHRLLRHVPMHSGMETANTRGKAVETFTNILAEVREYGESILIVDQIPAKLSPDVVKNTSLKIVHRLLAQDDRDFVGSTMILTEEQKLELPLLKVGRVVVHREGMDKPFHLQIPDIKSTCKKISSDNISDQMSLFQREYSYLQKYLPDLPETLPELPTGETLSQVFKRCDFRAFNTAIYQGVIGMVLLWLSDEKSIDPMQLRSQFQNEFASFNLSNAEQVCHVIWHGEKLFAELNAHYPHRYNHYLGARRAWLALYCAEDDSPLLRRNMCTALKNLIAPLQNINAPFLRWYATHHQHEKQLSILLGHNSISVNHPILDDFLDKKIADLLPLPCCRSTMDQLKVSLLSVILHGDPEDRLILQRYKNFAQQL